VTLAVRFTTGTASQENPSVQPRPEPPSLPDVVPDRVTQKLKEKHGEVLPEQDTPAQVFAPTEFDDRTVDILRGVYRVSDNETKTEVIDTIEKEVVGDASWYKIESHDCDHDRDKDTGCGDWTTEKTYGNIPQGV